MLLGVTEDAKKLHIRLSLALEDLRFSLRRHTWSWNASNNPIFLIFLTLKESISTFKSISQNVYFGQVWFVPFYTWENELLIRQTVTWFKVRVLASQLHLLITPYWSYGCFRTNFWILMKPADVLAVIFFTLHRVNCLTISRIFYIIKTDFLKACKKNHL